MLILFVNFQNDKRTQNVGKKKKKNNKQTYNKKIILLYLEKELIHKNFVKISVSIIT